MNEILIGIDGGGTYTRALCTDLSGQVLAYAEGDGSSPRHNSNPCDNVHAVLSRVIKDAGHKPEDVAGLAAGLAGLDRPEDEIWAAEFTALPGINCGRLQINDSIIAHAGAFGMEPGILCIAGTGSITTGIAESGAVIRNYDYFHFARTAACHLAFEAVFRLLTDDIAAGDALLCDQVLSYWQANTLEDLREKALYGADYDVKQVYRQYGVMAPLVTEAAYQGSPLAKSVCDSAIQEIATGIALVGICFESEDVSVALHGGVMRSAYMQQGITSLLDTKPKKRYHVIEPLLPPVCGAILLAAKEAGSIDIDTVRDNLSKADMSAYRQHASS